MSPDTADSDFVRKSDKLTGVVVEAGVGKVAKPIPVPTTSDEWSVLCKPVLQTWARAGCTTVFDAGIGSVSDSDINFTGAITTSPICTPLPVRFLGAVSINSVEKGLLPSNTPPVLLGNVTADGSTQGFTAAVNEPYIKNLNPKPDPCGTLNYPYDSKKETPLTDLMSKWMAKGWQLLVHSNGDRATDRALGCSEEILPKTKDETIMQRIEHFTVTSPAQVSRAASLGLGISHTIGHVYYWGQAFIHWVLGPDRAMRIDPVHGDSSKIFCYSFHNDSPVTNVNPLLHIKTAISRLMYSNGQILGENAACGAGGGIKGREKERGKTSLDGR
ncbi:hypothetical protein OEA41_002767 [Lepraria neglecta]|uniref:Amidohydrolase 3 domain-containing protein n=1 Tax=Lepraria neglecta TaxID=209136 RepID=A0AAD9Z3M0_9LECA|nr:hypothetical protein OEA41_002767 [Lepraria neglecta]